MVVFPCVCDVSNLYEVCLEEGFNKGENGMLTSAALMNGVVCSKLPAGER